MSPIPLMRITDSLNAGMTVHDFIVRNLPADWDHFKHLQRQVDFYEARDRKDVSPNDRKHSAAYPAFKTYRDVVRSLYEKAAGKLVAGADEFIISGTKGGHGRPVPIDLSSISRLRVLGLVKSAVSVTYPDGSETLYYDVLIQRLPPSSQVTPELRDTNKRKRVTSSPKADAVANALRDIGLRDGPGGLKLKAITRMIEDKVTHHNSFDALYQEVKRYYNKLRKRGG